MWKICNGNLLELCSFPRLQTVYEWDMFCSKKALLPVSMMHVLEGKTHLGKIGFLTECCAGIFWNMLIFKVKNLNQDPPYLSCRILNSMAQSCRMLLKFYGFSLAMLHYPKSGWTVKWQTKTNKLCLVDGNPWITVQQTQFFLTFYLPKVDVPCWNLTSLAKMAEQGEIETKSRSWTLLSPTIMEHPYNWKTDHIVIGGRGALIGFAWPAPILIRHTPFHSRRATRGVPNQNITVLPRWQVFKAVVVEPPMNEKHARQNWIISLGTVGVKKNIWNHHPNMFFVVEVPFFQKKKSKNSSLVWAQLPCI